MKIETIMRIANVILFLVNIALFCLWFSLVRVDGVHTKDEATSYLLSEVSTQVTVLGVMVTFGALLIAGLGLFGFQAAIERAESRAETVATKLISQKFEDWVRRYNPVAFGINSGPSQSASTKTEDAREIGGL